MVKTHLPISRMRTTGLSIGLPPILIMAAVSGACSSDKTGDGDGATTSSSGDGDSGSGSGDGDGATTSSSGDGDSGSGDSGSDSSGDGDPTSTAGDGDGESSSGNGGGDSGSSSGDGDGGSTSVDNPLTDPDDGPAAGWSEGNCDIPNEAGLEDVSTPTTVVGTGTPDSCTGDAFVAAVAGGGVITFDCGDEPHTIMLNETAKVFNDTGPKIVIDGGGLITLSGQGQRRILYMNTCDQDQKWTTAHCDNQDHPRLTVQNITFIDGSTADEPLEIMNEQGKLVENMAASGGAAYISGGRFKAINTRWFNNHCPQFGHDKGGGALRVMQQHEGLPIYIVNSTFGGQKGYGNSGAHGGAISSIGQSWSIYNSLFSFNAAVGMGAGEDPGGGNGGAIYNDGNEMTLSICGSLLERNQANEFGDAIFFVSNNYSGNVVIKDSTISNNCGTNGAWNPDYPGISNHEVTDVSAENSQIEGCQQ